MCFMQQTSTFTNDNFSKGPRMSSENRVVFSAKLLFANHCLSFLSSLILNWTENQKEVILIKNKKIWKYFLLKIQQKHTFYTIIVNPWGVTKKYHIDFLTKNTAFWFLIQSTWKITNESCREHMLSMYIIIH